uniref:GRAM domain-containing protein n=1 Tax=Cuerna arida TaxID=1464854 RepID=A0A1B6FM93_9HEMI
MLCLVQSFQQSKDKSSKGKRLGFIRRKKSNPVADNQDENLLHPNISRETSGSFWRQQRQGLQLLSGSAPSVTCPPIPASPSLTPSTCRSRQKKFLRHFKVDPEEKVIDYYSCALVADILLQGHLYISKNYFAFYSNVFGYVTKLLIPTTSVVNVTKEKTAYILPNAVGVATADDRHVFSSLLSRDSTYKLMVQVWHSALASQTADVTSAVEVDGSVCEESPSISGSESTCEVKTSGANLQVPTAQEVKDSLKPADNAAATASHPLPCATLLLVFSTALLIILFLSATVLMYRLSLLQNNLSTRGSRPLFEVQEFLDLNLNNLYKVRQSLETLSVLLENEKEKIALKGVEHHNSETVKLTDSIPSAVESGMPQHSEELLAS